MIRKSGNRFSEKIMLKQELSVPKRILPPDRGDRSRDENAQYQKAVALLRIQSVPNKLSPQIGFSET
jgi:hypothetical protein